MIARLSSFFTSSTARSMNLKPLLLAALVSFPPVAGAAVFSDNFDSYPLNSQMHGLGGWKGWDNVAAAGAFTNNDFFLSGPNSVTIEGNSDLVHQFTGATSGQWTFSCSQFVPSTSTGDSFIILLNNYNDGGPYNWSMTVHMNMATNQVISDEGGGGPLALIKNQWVPIRVDINLNSNTMSAFYNNQLLATHIWATGADSNIAVGALDLFANGAGPVMYDNISLIPEPSMSVLMLAGAVGFGGVRRRKASV